MRLILRLVANAAALAIATWILSGITLTGRARPARSDPADRGVDLRGAQCDHQADLRSRHDTAHPANPWSVLDRDQCLHALAHLMAGGLFDLGWHVDGFWTALLGAIIISIVSFVLNVFLPDPDDKRS